MQKFTVGAGSYVLLATVIVLFYANTLTNGFVYDDVRFISQNELIRSISNIPKILTGCLTQETFGDCKSTGVYYHPFLFLQFLFTYQISKAPAFFHLVNLFLFFVDSVLVLKLLQNFTSRNWAFLGALIFLLNPINSEIGNFASTVNDHYLLIFFILSFLAYIKFSRTLNVKYLIFSSAFYFLALMAKETAIFLFLVIVIYEMVIKGSQKLSKKFPKYYLIGTFLVPVILYLLLRLSIFGTLAHNLKGYHDLDLYSQVLTSISIYPLYLIKLVYPLPLNAQHDPPVITAVDWRFFASLVFWAVNAFLVYLAFRKKLKLAVLGASLIFLSLLPILLMINKIGRFILAERYLYLATVGVSLILIEFVQTRYRIVSFRSGIGKAMLGAFLVYMGVSWWIVFNRNRDWHDELSFNKSIAKYTKTNAGVWYNLGTNYSGINQYDLAVEAYQKSLGIDPNFWQARNNLANAYLNLGMAEEARGEYEKVLKIDEGQNSARRALGNLALLKSGTQSARLRLEGNLIRYSGSNRLIFHYPVSWNLKENYQSVTLTDSDNAFTVEISRDLKPGYLSTDEYLKNQTGTFGKLINEGLAQIPNFEKAWVKVWQGEKSSTSIKSTTSTMGSEQIQILQFFLFKDGRVIKILVGDANSPQMRVFDLVLGSIRISK